MPRKTFGWIDADLLERVDRKAWELGQTRRVFTERALMAALGDELSAHDPNENPPRFRSAPRSSSLQNFMPN
jgi:hypothetical protein